jgi:hypothetical protein
MAEEEREVPTGPLICNITAESATVRPGTLARFRVELCPRTASDGLTLEVQGEARDWATVEPITVVVREEFWMGRRDLFPVPFFDVRFQIPPSWNPPIGLTPFGIKVFWRARPEAATLGRGTLLLEGYRMTTEGFEWRMRPGRWSIAGFLGQNESLNEVMDQDDRTLKQLGLTYEELATALEKLFEARSRDESEEVDKLLEARSRAESDGFTFDEPPVDRDDPLGNPKTIGEDPRFAVVLVHYMGSQDCPWSTDWTSPCDAGPTGAGHRWSSVDWRISNLRTGQEMRGPGLAVHLIRDHHFFEGQATRFRVDPRELARLLGMGPEAEWTTS